MAFSLEEVTDLDYIWLVFVDIMKKNITLGRKTLFLLSIITIWMANAQSEDSETAIQALKKRVEELEKKLKAQVRVLLK